VRSVQSAKAKVTEGGKKVKVKGQNMSDDPSSLEFKPI
jgi:hypothetical protein